MYIFVSPMPSSIIIAGCNKKQNATSVTPSLLN